MSTGVIRQKEGWDAPVRMKACECIPNDCLQ